MQSIFFRASGICPRCFAKNPGVSLRTPRSVKDTSFYSRNLAQSGFPWLGLCDMVIDPKPTARFMLQPQSIRFHLAAVFLLFFTLVVVLGSFSIWRLANFNLLSADVAEIWLPTTRALGDLNNYTSDFRAVEGGNLLSTNPTEAAATEKEMAELDRTIAASEREFEAIRHDAAESDLYDQFKV